MWAAAKYYAHKLGEGELPPNECIEIALWDRFGWGPTETNQLTSKQLRNIFIVMEQERWTKDAVENLGKPDFERFQKKKNDEAMQLLAPK